MPKMCIYEVIVPDDKRIIFEELMKKSDFGCRDTGFFRIADLDAFFKGTQKPVT